MSEEFPLFKKKKKVPKRTDAVFTLQEFCVYEQLQRQEEHHQDDTGHQDTVEAGAEQTDLPQGYTATTTRLQPV